MEGSCLHSRVLALCHQRQVLVGGVGPTEAGLDSDVLGSDPGSATSWPCSPGQVIPPLQLLQVRDKGLGQLGSTQEEKWLHREPNYVVALCTCFLSDPITP